jgi:hypothetical protein
MRGFDYNPIGNMHNTSRITPIINAGLTALRFHQKKYPNFQFPEPKFLLPSNRPNSDSICQRRRKMLMLKLSGADEDMICNIMPTYYKGLIQSETSTIRKSVLPNISATYKECLLNYNFREVAIIYSILLGHYAAGHLSFGTPCEVNDFIVDTLDKHKLKIFAANEVNNLIKTA